VGKKRKNLKKGFPMGGDLATPSLFYTIFDSPYDLGHTHINPSKVKKF